MEMSRIETSLTRLETQLRSAFEGIFLEGESLQKMHSDLLKALLQSCRSKQERPSLKSGATGTTFNCPDIYTIILPENQANILINHPPALDALAQKMENSASRLVFGYAGSPMLRVVCRPKH